MDSYQEKTLAQKHPFRGGSFLIFLMLSACAAPKAEPKLERPETNQAYEGFGLDSVSESDLERYAPPSPNPQTHSQIQRLLDLRSPGYGIPSPDGSRLYFTWTVTGNRQIWRVDGPMRFPIQMTAGEDSSFLSGLSPDGKWLVVLQDDRGDEQYGIYLQSSEGGPLREVFRRPRTLASYEFITEDSKYLYFRANLHSPDSFTIFRYNIDERLTEEVVRLDGFWNISDHRADGRLLLRKARGSLHSEYFEFDPNTEELHPLFGQDEDESYTAAYSHEDGVLYVRTNRFDDFNRLYRWENDNWEALTPERSAEIGGFTLDRSRQRVLLTLNEGGYYSMEAYEAGSWTPLETPSSGSAEQLFRGSLSEDGRWMTYSIMSSNHPSKVYMYDWKTGESVLWLDSSTPEIDLGFAVTASLESYPARDGTDIPMFVWRPRICELQTCPVIVDFHGGPEAQAIPSFSATGIMLQQRGFIYVQPNVRGSSGYGRKWIDADNAEKRLDVISDIEDAAIYIRDAWAKNGAAPKVGVMGGSYGGYATLMAMTKFSGAYDAGVSIVGITNLLTFLQNTAPYRRSLRISEYGDPETQQDVLLELSPITYRDRAQDPLMIIHGATDPRVPVGEAILMYDSIQDRDGDSRLIIFPDEGHGIRKRENQAKMLSYIIDFFEEYLR